MPRIIRLIQGDCFEELPKIESKIDLIVADPPYEIGRISSGGTVNDKKKLNASLGDLKEVSDITKGYDIEAFAELVRNLQEDEINAYFFCNKRQIPEYFRVYVDTLRCKFDILCWHKQNALPTYSNKYLSDTEYILYFHKGAGKTFPASYDDAKTYYTDYINHSDKKLWGHPTIKPLPLIEKIVRNSTRRGGMVLDPFMGSGTTGVACLNNGRNFIGIELSDAYYQISRKRILSK